MPKIIVLPATQDQAAFAAGRKPANCFVRCFGTKEEAVSYREGVLAVSNQAEYEILDESASLRCMMLDIDGDEVQVSFKSVLEMEAYKLGLKDGKGFDSPRFFKEGAAGFDELAEMFGGPGIFLITRTLDYRISQQFAVTAITAEEAEGKVGEFVDSDWSSDAAKRLGVVQLSDEMEQIDNTQEIEHNEQLPAGERPKVQDSMPRLINENHAQQMYEMLKKVVECPQMYLAGISELGMEVKTFMDALNAKLVQPEALVTEVFPAAAE